MAGAKSKIEYFGIFIRFSIKFHNAGTVSGTESALLDYLTLVI
jgi:hypothetical protein